MEITEKSFAKTHLSTAVRFVTALKLTSIKHLSHGTFSAPSVLFALMNSITEYGITLQGCQKNIIANTSFSDETNKEIRDSFLSLYHDDEALLSYLNGKMRKHSIKRYKNKFLHGTEESEILLKNIFKTDLLDDLDL